MATKPSVSTEWASNIQALKEVPTTEQQSYGWSTSDNTVSGVPVKPNLQNQNGWQNATHQWIDYLDSSVDEQRTWFKLSASSFLSERSARKIVVQGQTAKVVLTFQTNNILAGDTFEIKNLGPENLGNNDIHLVEIKTSDTSSFFIAWLYTDDSIVLRANKNNPSKTLDWDIVKLDRPNGLSDLMNLDFKTEAGFTGGQYQYDIVYADEYNAFYFVGDESTIYKTNVYGSSPSQVTIDFPSFGYYFDGVAYIKETGTIFVWGVNSSNYPVLVRSTDGINFNKIYETNGGFFFRSASYNPSNGVLSFQTSGFLAGFVYSTNNGDTLQPSTSYQTEEVPFVAFDQPRNRYLFYGDDPTAGPIIYYSFDGQEMETGSKSIVIRLPDGTNETAAQIEVQNFIYNPFTKIYFMFYQDKNGTGDDTYKFAYSYDGISFVSYLPIYESTSESFSARSYRQVVATPFGSIMINEDGLFYIQDKTNGFYRQNLPLNNDNFTAFVNLLWCWGYSYRHNRIIGFEGFGPHRILKNGRL